MDGAPIQEAAPLLQATSAMSAGGCAWTVSRVIARRMISVVRAAPTVMASMPA